MNSNKQLSLKMFYASIPYVHPDNICIRPFHSNRKHTNFRFFFFKFHRISKHASRLKLIYNMNFFFPLDLDVWTIIVDLIKKINPQQSVVDLRSPLLCCYAESRNDLC
jgi:hypothetical protein